MQTRKKKKPGRRPCGVTDFVRQALRRDPRLTTQALRELARTQFGYTPDIDRHFPQLVYHVRLEMRKRHAATG